MEAIISQINHVAVAAAAVVFFIIGSLWFSALFQSMWVEELKEHDVKLKNHDSAVLRTKMILTFVSNYIASYAVAFLVIMTDSVTAHSGFMLGTIAAIGFIATAIASVFIWENRSLRLFLIDAGYPAVGIIVASMILSVWR